MRETITLNDGTAMWTTTSGVGAPVVFLNGGPGMADYLGPVADLLLEHLHIHRYEPRGCGRTRSDGPFTLTTFIADLEELRKHWGHDSWYVLGHSWGVDLALAYALAHSSSVRGLVGLSGGRIHNDRDWKQVYDANRHREQLPVAAAAPNMQVNKLLNNDWKAYCRRPELLSELASLDLPVLFLYGQEDIRPAWPTQQLSNLLPNSKFQMIGDADHHLWQNSADELRDRIIGFLGD